jgi:hypothetical protein
VNDVRWKRLVRLLAACDGDDAQARAVERMLDARVKR